MRAILIDPFERSVTEVEYNGDWETINQHLTGDAGVVDTFTTITLMRPTREHDGVTLFLDDIGWNRDQAGQQYFWLKGYPQLLAGRGLLLACNEAGESVGLDMHIDTDKVWEGIKWQDKETASAFTPPPPSVHSF